MEKMEKLWKLRRCDQVYRLMRREVPGFYIDIELRRRRNIQLTAESRYRFFRCRILKLKRIKRTRMLLPPEPKKALTPYNYFIKHFIKQKENKGLPHKEGVRQASKIWNEMGPEERAPYVNKAKNLAPAQQNEKNAWKAQRKAVSRAPNPYTFFLKDFWKTKKYNGKKGFREVAKAASKKWKSMKECDKMMYRTKSKEAQEEVRRARKSLGFTKMSDLYLKDFLEMEEKKKEPKPQDPSSQK